MSVITQAFKNTHLVLNTDQSEKEIEQAFCNIALNITALNALKVWANKVRFYGKEQGIKTPFSIKSGLCVNLRYQLAILSNKGDLPFTPRSLIKDCFSSWDHYSGDHWYPIEPIGYKLKTHLDRNQHFNSCTNKYIGDYGDQRMDLLDHCIDYLTELLKLHHSYLSSLYSSETEQEHLTQGNNGERLKSSLESLSEGNTTTLQLDFEPDSYKLPSNKINAINEEQEKLKQQLDEDTEI